MHKPLPMISEKTSRFVFSQIHDYKGLMQEYRIFMASERHISPAIEDLIDNITKAIMLHNANLTLGEAEEYDEEDEELEMALSEIDNAMQTVEHYETLRAPIARAFAAGLTCGRAKFDQDFLELFKEHRLEQVINDIF
jgi:hypothetical protein